MLNKKFEMVFIRAKLFLYHRPKDSAPCFSFKLIKNTLVWTRANHKVFNRKPDVLLLMNKATWKLSEYIYIISK